MINFDLKKQVLSTIQFNNNNIKEQVEKLINLYNKRKELKKIKIKLKVEF